PIAEEVVANRAVRFPEAAAERGDADEIERQHRVVEGGKAHQEVRTENLELRTKGDARDACQIVRSARRAGEAVVRKEDHAPRAKSPRGLDVLDDLIRRQAIRADAGPDPP